MVVACMHITPPIAAACKKSHSTERANPHGSAVTRVFDDCAVLATAVAWREPQVSAEMASIGSVLL
jgi:hypothetical protein